MYPNQDIYFILLQLPHGFVWKRIFQTIELYEKLFFVRLQSKIFIMRTILLMIKFSVIVHLCVENSFSWWNSLFLFFNLKHQIDWYIKHTKYFLRVPCGIHSGLLCYHKKQKQQLLKTAFVTIATKFVSVFWVCHNKWKLWRNSVLVILLKAITFQDFFC